MKSLFLFAFFGLFAAILAQAPEQDGIDDDKLEPVEPSDFEFERRERFKCNKDFREFDGVCTNNKGRRKKLWGSTNRPQFSYFNLLTSKYPRGLGLKSAREISNIVFNQDTDVFDERGLAEIATFIGQFIDHTIVATPKSEKDEQLPIDIPAGDTKAQSFTRGKGTNKLPFTRSQRVKLSFGIGERAQNSLTSAMDLANVYGPNKDRNNALREGHDGLMTLEDGFLQENKESRVNAPGTGTDFFLAGDHRSNEHPVLTALHTLFVREHNHIAEELKGLFEELSDDELFQQARKINEAQWQKIVFEEFYPAVTGHQLPEYTRFKSKVNPTVSLIFTTAAFRVGHTMVGDSVKRFGHGNKIIEPTLSLSDSFFPGIRMFKDLLKRGTGKIDDFLRGAINSPAQKVDNLVVDGLRNFLFKKIPGEDKNFDLVSLNIQRGRDHGIEKYVKLRAKFNKPKPKSFADITTNVEVQDRLKQAYGNVNKVEAFPGLMCEDHAPGSSLGKTLLKIWEREFLRMRDGDRFYFRNPGALDQRFMIPRLQRALNGKDTQVFREIIIRNTDIKDDELPEKLFFVKGRGLNRERKKQ